MRIIGISGRMRSGKDTFCQYLAGTHIRPEGKSFTVYHFADPIYAMLDSFLGGDWPQDNEGAVDKTAVVPGYDRTVRHMLQTLGTEWGRELIHPDVWVIKARQYLEQADALGMDYAIIPDVRFPNEVCMLRDMEGILVHLVRPEVATEVLHVSEAGVRFEHNDVVISNAGSIEEFYCSIDSVAPRLLQ